MRRKAIVLIMLGAAARVDAGAVIELVSDISGPYLPRRAVSVGVWLHNDDAVGHDLRLVALDVRALRERLFSVATSRLAGPQPSIMCRSCLRTRGRLWV